MTFITPLNHLAAEKPGIVYTPEGYLAIDGTAWFKPSRFRRSVSKTSRLVRPYRIVDAVFLPAGHTASASNLDDEVKEALGNPAGASLAVYRLSPPGSVFWKKASSVAKLAAAAIFTFSAVVGVVIPVADRYASLYYVGCNCDPAYFRKIKAIVQDDKFVIIKDETGETAHQQEFIKRLKGDVK